MTRIHRFRVIETSWGVAVDLTARLEDDALTSNGIPLIQFSDERLATLHQTTAEIGLQVVVSSHAVRVLSLAGKSLIIDRIEYTPTAEAIQPPWAS